MPTDYRKHPPFQSFTPKRQTLPRRSSTWYGEPGTATSLFDRLPAELVAEIFSHCLQAYPQIGNGEAPEMAIAKVCHAWRTLAHSTPRLWSSFEIEVQDSYSETDDPDSPRSLSTLSTVKIWLERSKNQPLSFRLIHIPTGRVPNQLSAQLLAIFVLQTRRWRHVEIVAPSTALVAVQHLFPAGYPLLKSLKLHMQGVWNSARFAGTSVLGVPWQQLTELDLRLDHNHLLNLDDYADLLRSATSLTVCRVNAGCASVMRPTKRDTLVLPSLKDLHLILQGEPTEDPATETALVSFLDLFSGCALEHFGINWLIEGERSEQWTSVHPAFTRLLKDLSPSLLSLELTYLPIGTDAALIEYLSQLPRLGELDLRFSLADQVHDPITGRVLRALTLPNNTPQSAEGVRKGSNQSESSAHALMPNLHHIHIQCTGEHCKQAELVDLVDSRTRSLRDQHLPLNPSPLRGFSFYSMKQVVDRIHIHVNQWSEVGIDVAIDSVFLL